LSGCPAPSCSFHSSSAGAEDEVAGFLRRLDRAELAGASRDGREGVAAADGYLRIDAGGSMRGERGSADVRATSRWKV
jgi:hypothetical protein